MNAAKCLVHQVHAQELVKMPDNIIHASASLPPKKVVLARIYILSHSIAVYIVRNR